MWRAYGLPENVALVFNNDLFLSDSRAFTAFASPVLYANSETFQKGFQDVVDSFEKNLHLAESLGGDEVGRIVTVALHAAVLATKHPGFAEEK